MKKLCSVLIIAAMLFAMVPAVSRAETAAIIYENPALQVSAAGTVVCNKTVALSDGVLKVVSGPEKGSGFSVEIYNSDDSVKVEASDQTQGDKWGWKSEWEVKKGEKYTITFFCKNGYAKVDGTVSALVQFTAGQVTPSTDDKAEKAWDTVYTSSNPLKVGTYSLTLDPSAVNTLYFFKPGQMGKYTFTVDENATVGFWGAGAFYIHNPNSTSNVLEWEIKDDAYAIVIGISSSNPTVTLNIEKTGDSLGNQEKEYINYTNVHKPSSKYNYNGASAVYVNIREYHTAILGSDGFYHLDSATGPVLYVELNSDGFNLTSAYGSYGANSLKGTYNGVDYNFKDAMEEYKDVLSSSGRYYMTEDLYKFLKGYGNNQFWYDQSKSPFLDVQRGGFDERTVWLVTCLYEPSGNMPEIPEDPVDPTNPSIPDIPTEPTVPTEPTTKPTVHTHSYTKVVTAATCTQDGYTTYTCQCGYSYIADKKPATGHSWGKWNTVLAATEEAPGREERLCSKCNAKEERAIEQLEHIHSYTSAITKQPSCTEEGIKTFTCKCGDSYTEAIAKLAHTYTSKVTAPTCTEKGYTLYTCQCGDSYKTNEKPALGHSWGQWITVLKPTEDSYGREERVCSRCNAKEERGIDQLEHTHSYTSVITKQPSCTEEGIKTFTCKCGHSYTETIAKLLHQYVASVVAPTCTEKGYTLYTCQCGDNYKTDEKPASGHSWGKWNTVLAATEEAPGREERLCSKCNAKEERAIDQLAHTHSYTSVITRQPSCTEEGIKTFTCKCGHSYTETIAKLLHQYVASVVAPTCTEKGYTLYTCQCGDSYKTNEKPATGHSWAQWTTVLKPTEEAPGREERLCYECGAKEERAIDQLVHTHSYTSQVTKEPSCTEEGIKTFTCRCGDSYTETIAKLTHQYTPSVVAPTCTEKGYTLYTCQCGDNYKANEKPATGHFWSRWTTVVAPTEEAPGREERVCGTCGAKETREVHQLEHTHSYTSSITKEPSCTEEGIKTFTCKCGDSYTDVIAKLLHTYVSSVVAPTCTEKGYTSYVCVCGDSYHANEKPATGHSWGKWNTVLAATEEAPGREERVCSKCSAKEERAIEQLAHTHSYTSSITKEPSCTEEGIKTFTCRCGDSFSDVIAKLVHTYASSVVAPTCTEKGYTLYVCVCGDSYSANEKPAVGHVWSEWTIVTNPTEEVPGMEQRFCGKCDLKQERVIQQLEHTHSYTSEITKEATCTEEGIKTFTCRCGDSYTEVITKLVHEYVASVMAPTCTEKGYTIYTCQCGNSYKTNEKPATGHSWGKWNTVVAATEEAAGKEVRVCSKCDAKEERAIDQLAHTHSYTSAITKQPSCTEEGIKTFSCKCGDSYTEVIAKLTHQYTASVVAPTCTEKGYTWYTCQCGDSYKTNEKPAAGHSWGKWTVVQAATEDAPGKEARVCSKCDAQEERPLAQLPHTHSYTAAVTKEPSYTEEGIRTFTCRCGDSYTEVIPKLTIPVDPTVPTEPTNPSIPTEPTTKPTAPEVPDDSQVKEALDGYYVMLRHDGNMVGIVDFRPAYDGALNGTLILDLNIYVNGSYNYSYQDGIVTLSYPNGTLTPMTIDVKNLSEMVITINPRLGDVYTLAHADEEGSLNELEMGNNDITLNVSDGYGTPVSVIFTAPKDGVYVLTAVGNVDIFSSSGLIYLGSTGYVMELKEGQTAYFRVSSTETTNGKKTVSLRIQEKIDIPPVDPPEPPIPTEPTTQPVVPTEPTTQPVVPTEPTTQPVVPTEPTTQPVVPTDPTTQPVVPTDPTTQPVVPTEPTTQPVVPTEPTTQPAAPTESGTQTAAPTEPSASGGANVGDSSMVIVIVAAAVAFLLAAAAVVILLKRKH